MQMANEVELEKKERLIVITEEVMRILSVKKGSIKVRSFFIQELNDIHIKNTSIDGDAFVGAFPTTMNQIKSYTFCKRWGLFAAAEFNQRFKLTIATKCVLIEYQCFSQ